jgi:tetratricopeptide (TPR) repeat protein
MSKNENSDLSETQLFHESIETLFQAPLVEKYIEQSFNSPLPPQSKKKSLTLLIKGSLLLVVAVSLYWGFLKFGWPLIKSGPVNQLVHLRGPCPDFTGRNEYLNVLYKELISKWEPSTARIQGLWGKGGFGKTELAIEFANRFRPHFSIVWTFYCDSDESLKQGYRELAKQFGLYNPSDSPLKTREKVHFYLENVKFREPWLLIFDNVEDKFPDYPQRGGSILFTSQKKVFNPQYLLEIKPFSKEESLELLEKITGESRNSSMERLAQDLERIPLLINYAAHYIKSTPGCNTADYQNLFCTHLSEKAGPLWKETDINRRYQKSLASSWQFSLKVLEKEHPDALAWLYVCSYLYPENIPETWIDDWLAFREKKTGQSFEIKRREILQSLQNFGIIHFQEEKRTFSLHRFFQSMIRESRSAHLQEDLLTAFELILKHTYDYDFFKPISWEVGKNWSLQAYEFLKWLEKYPQYSSDSILLKKAILFSALAYWNVFNYHYSAAIDFSLEAAKVRKNLTQEIAPQYAFNYIAAGFCYYKLGRPREGLKYLDQVEQILSNHRYEHPLDFSTLMDVKGLCHYELREFGEALRCYQEGVLVNRKYQGDQYVQGLFNFDSMTYSLLADMGKCLRDMGRCNESMDCFNLALPLGIKTCGRKHPYNLKYTIEKGLLVLKMGKPEQALKIMQNALNEYYSLKGQECGEFAVVWYGMGMAYLHTNNTKKAKEILKKASSCSLKYLGKQSYILVRTHLGMGQVYLREKNVKKGLNYFRKYLHRCADYKIKPEHMIPVFEELQNALIDAQQVKGSILHVQQTAKEAALLSEKILGKDHALTEYFRLSPSMIDNSKVKI